MLDISTILFNDGSSPSGVHKVEDVVVVQMPPSDMITSYYETYTRHVIPLKSVLETQHFVANRLNMPYKSDKEALADYLSVHWCWCDLKVERHTQNPQRDISTDIITKEPL